MGCEAATVIAVANGRNRNVKGEISCTNLGDFSASFAQEIKPISFTDVLSDSIMVA